MNTAIWIVVLVVVGVMLYSRFGGTITLPGLPKMDFRLAAFGGAALAAFYVLYRVHGLVSQEVPGYEQTVGEGAGFLLGDPILALSLLVLFGFVIWKWWPWKSGQAGVSGTSTTAVTVAPQNTLPPGHVIGGQWLPKGLPFKDRLSTGFKAILGFVAVAAGGYLLVLNSPSDWRLVHGDAYVPVRGLVWSSALAALWIAGEIQKRSGSILMIAFFATVILVAWGLSGDSYPMEEMFSPRMERFPDLPYWTELPGGLGKIHFSHIWIATAALAALVAIAKNPAWGGSLLMTPVFFLWNQLLG